MRPQNGNISGINGRPSKVAVGVEGKNYLADAANLDLIAGFERKHAGRHSSWFAVDRVETSLGGIERSAVRGRRGPCCLHRHIPANKPRNFPTDENPQSLMFTVFNGGKEK